MTIVAHEDDGELRNVLPFGEPRAHGGDPMYTWRRVGRGSAAKVGVDVGTVEAEG
jgi:hypothetical protein